MTWSAAIAKGLNRQLHRDAHGAWMARPRMMMAELIGTTIAENNPNIRIGTISLEQSDTNPRAVVRAASNEGPQEARNALVARDAAPSDVASRK
jgi:hypothetical protein